MYQWPAHVVEYTAFEISNHFLTSTFITIEVLPYNESSVLDTPDLSASDREIPNSIIERNSCQRVKPDKQWLFPHIIVVPKTITEDVKHANSTWKLLQDHFLTACHIFLSPIQCPAIDYTRHTLDGAACLLNSNKYFPSRWVLPRKSCHSLYYGMWINKSDIVRIFTWQHMQMMISTTFSSYS